MAFFDRMKDSLTTAGQEVSQKAKNATENVRLGNLIKNNDKMVDKLLYQVGLKYYEAHGQEEGTEYQELFAEINRLKSENAAYQQELDNLAATNQCPFNAKYVPILEETAQKNGIPLKAVKIENRKDAQNVPTPITTYALFCDGEYVTNEQMNDKKFLKLVGR